MTVTKRLSPGRSRGIPPLFSGRFLLLAVVLVVFNPGLTAQDEIRLTADFTRTPLRQAIKRLGEETGLEFSFLEDAVDGVVVNCRFTDADWPTINDCLFARHGLEAERLPGRIVTLRPGGLRDFTVCLRVTDSSGAPLSFITASNNTRGISLTADGEGFLQSTIRARPNDSLTLHYLGYQDLRVNVQSLNGTSGNCPELVLRPSTIELAHVTVTEYLTEGIAATEDGRRVLLDPKAVSPTPGFADREVLRSVTRLPGITAIGESAGNLSIRGGTPDQHLVLWDNIPVYSSGHFLSMISNFSPDLIGGVDVWRGRADSEYGGHVSGVIRMRTDREISERTAAGAGISLLQVNGFVRQPVLRNRSDVHLAYRGSLPALLSGPAYNNYRNQALQGFLVGEAEAPVEAFSFGEFNGRWQFNPAPGHELTLSGYRQVDRLTYSLLQPNSNLRFFDALSTTNEGLGLHYVISPSPASRTEAWLTTTNYFNLGENKFVNNRTDTDTDRRSDLRERSAKLLHTRQGEGGDQLRLGAQLQSFEHSFQLRSVNNLSGRFREISVFDGRATVLAAFGGYTWSTGAFRADFGLRVPYYTPARSLYFEPRLSASYELTGDWRLKTSYAFNHQFPVQILDLDLNRVSLSAPLWTLANDDIFPVQRGRELSVGVTASPRAWLFDLEGYHKVVDGLSAAALSLDQGGITSGRARSTGLDVLVRRRYGPWRSGLTYSLSRTRWQFLRIMDEDFAADFDRPHQLRLEQEFHRGPWVFTAAYQLNSGVPFTAATIGTVEQEDGTVRAGLVYGPQNEFRLPAYQRLDLAASYEWQPRPDRDWSGAITLSLLNLTNRTNLLERDFTTRRVDDPPPDAPRLETIPVDRTGLRFTPNLSLRIRWR